MHIIHQNVYHFINIVIIKSYFTALTTIFCQPLVTTGTNTQCVFAVNRLSFILPVPLQDFVVELLDKIRGMQKLSTPQKKWCTYSLGPSSEPSPSRSQLFPALHQMLDHSCEAEGEVSWLGNLANQILISRAYFCFLHFLLNLWYIIFFSKRGKDFIVFWNICRNPSNIFLYIFRC